MSQLKRQQIFLGIPMSPRVWWNFKSDFIATLFFSLFNVVMNQFYIAFALQQGATNLQVGILSAAPAVGLIFSPIWATWIEKANKPKAFTVIPCLIGRLLLIIPALFPNPDVYVIVAIVFQLLMGIQAPAYASLVSRMYPLQIRGRLMGYVRVGMGVLMIPMAYMVGAWTDLLGPRGPLIAAAIAGFISAAIFNSLKISKHCPVPVKLEEVHKLSRKDRMLEQFRLVKSHKMLAMFLIATTFAGFGNMMSLPLYQIIQVDILELSNVQIGYTRVAYYSALLLTFWLGGIFIDRFHVKYTLLVGIAVYAIVPMLYGLWGDFTAVMLGNTIQGIGDAIWDIGIMSFIFRILPGREAVVFGLHSMAFGIRGTIAPILGTSLTAILPIEWVLLAAAILSCIGTIVFFVSTSKEKEPMTV